MFGVVLTTQGCFFHLTQSTWKKLQELGLAVAYKTDDAFRHFCGMLNGLAFLPVQKLESLPLSHCRWQYGSIVIQIYAVGSKRRIFFCTRVRIDRSRSSKVDDFGTNRKRVCDLLFVPHCEYSPTLHRFWDTATYWIKMPIFATPSLIRRPLSLSSLWNFAVKLTVRKLESWGYPTVKTAHDRNLSRFDTEPACDRETRRTDLL